MPKQRLFIPSYFQPGSWKELLHSGAAEGSVVIINVYNGPGEARCPVHVDIADMVRQAKDVTLLGYVHTLWGKRDLTIVEQEIAAYQQWYGPMDGIFVDEVSVQAEDIPYYQELRAIMQRIMSKSGAGPATSDSGSVTTSPGIAAATVLMADAAQDGDKAAAAAAAPGGAAAQMQPNSPSSSSDRSERYSTPEPEVPGGPGPLLVFNYGCQMPETYMDLADIHVAFENPAVNYNNYHPPRWMRKYPPQRFCHLLYAVQDAKQLRAVVNRSQACRAGWVYVTNLDLPNPWGALPEAGMWSLLKQMTEESWMEEEDGARCPCIFSCCLGA